ncbi:YfdX family protein [Ruegeria marisrubri]|uniref:YfdX family protein n=1 Tax=Ruegeria marisrubri TaxID=1685379 RepID=UPI001CD45588|nr:YfdX family protein [Ruegeria marisrubri]MCA0906056.1 YfdX family protein [Ruegeria marisrubri]
MTRKSFLASTALATVMAMSSVSWAQGTADPETAFDLEGRTQVEDSVTNETDTQLSDKRTALIEEAISALDETHHAITAIEEGDTEAALAALAAATGKLETVVAREPGLALAPVDVNFITYDVLGSLQSIKDTGNRIEDLVDDGEFQKARRLLSNFASEVVIQTTSLPLATYPDAILEATALLDDGKTEEALTVLNTALGTQVIEETAVPLPPLRAEAMIEAAEEILKGEAEKDGDKAHADLSPGDYVRAARQELEIAEALGYGRERDFEDIHDDLDALEEQIKAQKDTGGILDAISGRFDQLRERIFN